MIVGCEAHGQHDEAWRLTQETFNAYLKNMSLSAPRFSPWIERMIVGCEAHGQHDEAWRLTQETFNAYLKNMAVSAPSFSPLAKRWVVENEAYFSPWIVRMVMGYEAREQYHEAWEVIRKTLDVNSGYEKSDHDLIGSCLLSKLRSAYKGANQGDSLLEGISRSERLGLLTNQNFPADLRRLVSKSLLDPSANHLLINLKIGSGKIAIHSDVLCFWSKYFKSALSGRWKLSSTYDLDPNNEFSTDALERIFKDYFYSGTYVECDPGKRKMDRFVAEYYLVDSLLAI
jgi:hypothetical protein